MTREEWEQMDGETVVAMGRAIYREKIRPLVHPQHKGKMVIIDLETGDYEMDCDPGVARERLWQRHPNCWTYGVRVGFKYAYHFGGSRVLDDEC